MYVTLMFPKFSVICCRRSPMSVLPFRKLCPWWLGLMLTCRGHYWTWWRPWLLHTLEKWVHSGKIDAKKHHRFTSLLTRHEANLTHWPLFLSSRKCKCARWPWSLPVQYLHLITCHPDTCCFWQLEIREYQRPEICYIVVNCNSFENTHCIISTGNMCTKNVKVSVVHLSEWCSRLSDFLCFRREEVSGEAQRVLRAFPNKSSEKEGPKPMPSFPDMVAYVQEKVSLSTYFPLSFYPGYFFPQRINVSYVFHCVIVRRLSGSRLQQSTLLEPPLFLSTRLHLQR